LGCIQIWHFYRTLLRGLLFFRTQCRSGQLGFWFLIKVISRSVHARLQFTGICVWGAENAGSENVGPGNCETKIQDQSALAQNAGGKYETGLRPENARVEIA